MIKRLLGLYQYLGPAILTPLAGWLWYRHFQGDGFKTVLAIAAPVLHAYIVPGIGTNVLHVWAFHTRLRLGRFRPHHGFVFGSATAMLTLPVVSWANSVGTAALGTGALLLAVNWIYDALALKYRVLEVYNQPWSEGAGPWRIAADYVPWFFGLFGAIYGGGLWAVEQSLASPAPPAEVLKTGALLLIATVCLPTIGYMAASRLRHGHYGCRPIRRTTA